MARLIVTVVRRGSEDREFSCRVTDADVTRYLAAMGDFEVQHERREATRAQIARDRAARRLFGRCVFWRGSLPGVPHRGQIWKSVKGGGGANAVTMEITMRVVSQ